MSFSNNPMGCNFLGVCFVDEELGEKRQNKVENKMEELNSIVNQMFENWLDEQGLEQVMGVVRKKQRLIKPKEKLSC